MVSKRWISVTFNIGGKGVSDWDKLLVIATVILAIAAIWTGLESQKLSKESQELFKRQITPEFNFIVTSPNSTYFVTGENFTLSFHAIDVNKDELKDLVFDVNIDIINTGFVPIVPETVFVDEYCRNKPTMYISILPLNYQGKPLKVGESAEFNYTLNRHYPIHADIENNLPCFVTFKAVASKVLKESKIRINTTS